MLWLKMIRPGTLLAALSPVLIGLIVALQQGSINGWVAAVTLLTALLIQIFSNLTNDYYDYKKGDDGEDRLGPQRAVSAGLISVKTLKHAIFGVGILILIGGLFLIWKGGWPILAIGLCALLFAWLYSATSFSLSRLGIADIFVFIFFGPVATVGTCYLQTFQFSWPAFWLGVGCGCISIAVLTVNNVRDYAQDMAHNKRTIVVRLGLKFATFYYLMLLFVPVIPMLFLPHPIWSCVYIFSAVALFLFFYRANGRIYNRVLVYTGLINLLYSIVVALAYYI